MKHTKGNWEIKIERALNSIDSKPEKIFVIGDRYVCEVLDWSLKIGQCTK